MGFQDRDYYREETEGRESPGGTLVATWVVRLLIANVVIYFVDLLFFTKNGLLLKLAAYPNTWSHPLEWWQFLTYSFAHDPERVGHLVMNMLGLWFFGRRTEQTVGGGEFLRFYLLAAVVGSLVWEARLAITGASHDLAPHLWGASGAVTAVIILAICHFPHERVLLFMVVPLPAWALGVLVVVLDVAGLTGAGGKAGVAFDVHLAGAALALIYFRGKWNLGRLFGRRRGAGWGWPLRRSPRLRVHPGSDPGTQDLESDYEALDAEADRILAKLHEIGDESLSERERRILEDYSRRMRQKHR